VFGFIIFIHEFGHFITARMFGVVVKEFSIGMGPKLMWYESKKNGTVYSLSMLPIGGYVAMLGEDEASDDPNSFDKKPAWQRFIITVAGASVNIVAGFLAMIILTAFITIGGTTVADFKQPVEGQISTSEQGLMAGDEIIKVGNTRVTIADELAYEIMHKGHEPIDLTVIRDGKEMVIEDVVFPKLTESGQTIGSMDFRIYAIEKDLLTTLSYSFTRSCLIVRMVWESLFDLFTGRFTFEAISGPVGIGSSIGEAASKGPVSLLYIVVLISINLGVMNLLPIPALDGGRLLAIAVEMVTGKRLPKNIEAAINGIGLILLLGLSFVIMIKDIFKIFM
jgi:regulator of sigma E protease